MVSRVVVYEIGLVRAVQTDGSGFTRKTANEIKVVAMAIAPKRTGRLARSHSVEQSRTATGQYQTGHSVSADAPYARYVHGGTRDYRSPGKMMGPMPVRAGGPKYIRFRRGQKANPWLQRAADSVL